MKRDGKVLRMCKDSVGIIVADMVSAPSPGDLSSDVSKGIRHYSSVGEGSFDDQLCSLKVEEWHPVIFVSRKRNRVVIICLYRLPIKCPLLLSFISQCSSMGPPPLLLRRGPYEMAEIFQTILEYCSAATTLVPLHISSAMEWIICLSVYLLMKILNPSEAEFWRDNSDINYVDSAMTCQAMQWIVAVLVG
jgi:hypothetical protein